MTAGERGFLLLTSHLGIPERQVLTPAQLRSLARYVWAAPRQAAESELSREVLSAMGLPRGLRDRVLALLQEDALLDRYLTRAARERCVPLTRATENYPVRLRRCLGEDSPGCLWARGNLALLKTPALSLVGSRDIREENRAFAREVGRQAARQGLTLVSGNARGADAIAQAACLEAGGQVISVVADALWDHPGNSRVLWLSEDSFDLPFTAQRALSRNRVIHCLGQRTLVAQCAASGGGTWDGTVRNLRFGWSPVFCYDDGSPAANALEEMGAILISIEDLENLHALPETAWGLL